MRNARRMTSEKINSKSQAPNPKYASNFNNQMTQTKKKHLQGLLFRTLGFGAWNLFGICDLEFQFYLFPYHSLLVTHLC
jgi:hypothetical protein